MSHNKQMSYDSMWGNLIETCSNSYKPFGSIENKRPRSDR
jgi:hypothetical protein